MTLKQINIKKKKHLLCNDLIDIEKFDPNLLDIEKKRIYWCQYLLCRIY